MSKENPTKVVTGKVRFSYANVFEPRSIDGGKEKYSVAILVPKKDKTTLGDIQDAVDAAAEVGKTSKYGGKIPANLKLPLRDGDQEKPDDENYAGMMFMNASSDRKPGLVDADLNPILDREEFYSGCYGRASVNFYPFNTNGNRGVACGLNNLQKMVDGDRLAGGSTPEADFGGEESLM